MIIDGIWWLVIIVAIIVILFVIAQLKKPNSRHKTSQNRVPKHTAKHSPLQKLQQQLSKHLPDYQFTVKKNHITISHADKKLAMITLNADNAVDTRKLGEVLVMNYHKPPNYQEVLAKLQKIH